jgi:hypothetical protein
MSPLKKKTAVPGLTPQDILADSSPEVRHLAGQLRSLIRETVPLAEERAYPGWRAIGFRHPTVGYFCGLFPVPEGVDLAFEFGVLLPDPNGLLDGNGKQVRYVRIRRQEHIQVEPIQALLNAAIDLPSDRQTRLALVAASARPA